MDIFKLDTKPLMNFIEYGIAQSQISEIVANNHLNFLITYLVESKKDIVKITNHTLNLNKIDFSITHFMKQVLSVNSGYIEVISQKKNSATLRLTSLGRLMADTHTYNKPIVKRTYLRRFIYTITSSFKYVILGILAIAIVILLLLALKYLFPLLLTPMGERIIVVIAAICTIIYTLYVFLKKE